MQFRVQKSDGTHEIYLHTKVMGAIAHALGEGGYFDVGVTEHLAEAVTTFLRRRYAGGCVSSDEIHSMIEVVLGDTGHEAAALSLHQHRLQRAMQRNRLEVVHHQGDLTVADVLDQTASCEQCAVEPWNKSIIAQDLTLHYGIPADLARALAGNVEEQVLQLGLRQVTSTVIKALVVNELLLTQRAQRALEARQPEPAEEPVAAIA